MLLYHCFNFILFWHKGHTNFDFNGQYWQNAVFSFEKCLNCQNHSSGSHHLVKNPPHSPLFGKQLTQQCVNLIQNRKKKLISSKQLENLNIKNTLIMMLNQNVLHSLIIYKIFARNFKTTFTNPKVHKRIFFSLVILSLTFCGKVTQHILLSWCNFVSVIICHICYRFKFSNDFYEPVNRMFRCSYNCTYVT